MITSSTKATWCRYLSAGVSGASLRDQQPSRTMLIDEERIRGLSSDPTHKMMVRYLIVIKKSPGIYRVESLAYEEERSHGLVVSSFDDPFNPVALLLSWDASYLGSEGPP